MEVDCYRNSLLLFTSVQLHHDNHSHSSQFLWAATVSQSLSNDNISFIYHFSLSAGQLVDMSSLGSKELEYLLANINNLSGSNGGEEREVRWRLQMNEC